MNRRGVVVVAAALVLAGCSGPSDPAPDAPASGTASSPAAAPSQPSGSAAASEPSGSVATSQPSGTADRAEQVLDDAGLLHDGVVQLGPAGTDDPAIDRAICMYVFGTPDRVAQTTGLPAPVSLTDDSGYQMLGGGGSGVQCSYRVDGVETLGVRLWSTEAEIDADESSVVVQTPVPGDRYGMVVIDPDWQGPRLSRDAATAWLTEAAARWGGASV